VALWEYLQKYGLDRASLQDARQAASREQERATVEVLQTLSPGGLVPVVPDKFFSARPTTPEPSCCGPRYSPGSTPTQPGNASTTTTARSRGAS
jgi:hypothetical protein